MDEAVKEQLRQCIALWNSTEKITKRAELINAALIRPSTNELRYAGRWIILALDAIIKGETQIDRHTTVQNALAYACLCCLQAKHDAIDSIVLFLHEKIDALNEQYGSRTIALYVQDYDHFLGEVESVDSIIVTSRGERENRGELYEKIVTVHLPKLMDFLTRIGHAETTINHAIDKERRVERRRNIYFYISLGFNVVLLALAIIPQGTTILSTIRTILYSIFHWL